MQSFIEHQREATDVISWNFEVSQSRSLQGQTPLLCVPLTVSSEMRDSTIFL